MIFLTFDKEEPGLGDRRKPSALLPLIILEGRDRERALLNSSVYYQLLKLLNISFISINRIGKLPKGL